MLLLLLRPFDCSLTVVSRVAAAATAAGDRLGGRVHEGRPVHLVVVGQRDGGNGGGASSRGGGRGGWDNRQELPSMRR